MARNFFLSFLFLANVISAIAQFVPTYGPEIKVTINGLTFDAMEPFISDDGQTLFFNSLNSGGNTNLYYATYVDDSTFNYVGLVGNAYDPAPSHLDGVPSLDINNRFFWVSLREYPTIMENLHNSDYSSGAVTNIKRTYGDFNIYSPGWLIMDAAINYQGDLLYYVNAYFNSCAFGMPCDAYLGVAQKANDTTFNKMINSDGIFSNINDVNYIVYAPQLTVDGKELYFTRILKTTVNSEICVSTRASVADTFNVPTVIYSNNGFVPEAATITNDKQRIYYHQKDATNIFHIYLRYRNQVVGVENEMKNYELIVFPNPAKTFFSIDVPTPELDFNVQLRSIDGRLVLDQKNSNIILVESLASGSYLVDLIQDNKIYTCKFIKE